MHCIIIGAGIIGMSTALELAQRGWRVTLLEQAVAGMQSSWAGGGILSPLHPWRYRQEVLALVEYSLQRYPKFIEQLQRYSNIDLQYIKSGALYIDRDSVQAGQRWAQQHRKSYLHLDARQLREYTEILNPYYEQALLLEEIYQVRTPRVLQALQHALHALRVTLYEQTPALRLQCGRHGVEGVITSRGMIASDKVVLSAGAWSCEWLRLHGLAATALQPVRGQMLLFEARPGLLRHIILDAQHYLIPRSDGKILVGSTLEETGFDARITPVAREILCRAAFEMMPVLREAEFKQQWAGLRPATPLGIPVIAQHPEIEGFYLHAGHFRNGVAMAPGSAMLMADWLCGIEPALDMRAYALS